MVDQQLLVCEAFKLPGSGEATENIALLNHIGSKGIVLRWPGFRHSGLG